MLHWFVNGAPGYQTWRAGHPGSFVIAIDQVIRRESIPLYSDGSENLRGVALMHRTLHRATCEQAGVLGRNYSLICGPREELENNFRDEDVQYCQCCQQPKR